MVQSIQKVPKGPGFWGGQTSTQTDTQTHQYHDSAWPSENPAYGRHRISQPMRIVGPIQFWRVCVIYLEKERKKQEHFGVDWCAYCSEVLLSVVQCTSLN